MTDFAAAPHAAAPGTLARLLETDLDRGLDTAEAASRLTRYGPNRPSEIGRPP